ncbi:MAG: MarR family transcriptional regulator [Clostridia bacterium]|nr:MarR family transcriptional regulator [Clostridia bacterium]
MDGFEFDTLRLENQLCFPLYACSKEIIRRYKPFLDPLDLTYTQYIALMVLWEKGCVSVKELGDMLYLDSGTLTPVLKKLETKQYITRTRSREDERSVLIALTDRGIALKAEARHIPEKMGACVKLEPEEAFQLYALLHKILSGLN